MYRESLESRVVIVLALCALCAGCTRYERQPFDVRAELDAWRTLGVDDARVASRAQADGVAYAPADGLALDEVVTLALVLNPTARAARLEADAITAGAGFAGRWADGDLEVQVRRVIGTGSSPWIISPGLTLTVPLSGRLAAERDRAEADASAAWLAALGVEQDIRLAVSRAWFDLARARQGAELLRGYVAALEPIAERVEALSEAGELPLEARTIMAIEAATARLQTGRAEARVRQHRAEVVELIGLTPQAEIALQPAFAAAPSATEPPDGWPERHPRIQQRLAEYAVGEHTVRREIARQYPDITLSPMAESDRGQTSIGLGFGLIPVPVFNRNQRGIAEARGRRAVLRARTTAALQSLVARTERTRDLEASAAERLVILETLTAELDAELDRLVRLALEGELDVLVLRQLLHSGLQTRQALVDARHEQAVARAELAALLAVVPESDARALGATP